MPQFVGSLLSDADIVVAFPIQGEYTVKGDGWGGSFRCPAGAVVGGGPYVIEFAGGHRAGVQVALMRDGGFVFQGVGAPPAP